MKELEEMEGPGVVQLGDASIAAPFTSRKPTTSQRTCRMIFSNKPNKKGSKKLKDKRRLSLLNTDFKLLSGIENSRHTKILEHTVSTNQFALGQNKNISHAIALARDTIWAAAQAKEGAAIADLDFMAAFKWVFLVLEKTVGRRQSFLRLSSLRNRHLDGVLHSSKW